MMARAVLLAVLFACGPGAASADAGFRRCNSLEWLGVPMFIDGDRRIFRSTQGNGAPDTAFWEGSHHMAAMRAWTAWYDLDPPDPDRVAISVDWDVETPVGFSELPDLVHVMHKRTTLPAGTLSRSRITTAFFAPIITEIDIELRGRTALSNPADLPQIGPQGRCAHNRRTTAAAAMHEVGHGYGYDHWLDWISQMNPGHRDALSCGWPVASTSVMHLFPDALSAQCHDLRYGLTPAISFGGSPVRQTCALASGIGCSSALSTVSRIPPGTLSTPVLATFTTFSRRDTHSGSVVYRMLLSRDRQFSEDDREIGRGTLTGWTAGATVTRAVAGRLEPLRDMPVAGVEYFVLIELDPDELVAPLSRIDTDIRVVRD